MRYERGDYYRITLTGHGFFGLYNGAVFDKSCFDPVKFTDIEKAETIAAILTINERYAPTLDGNRVISIDRYQHENGNIKLTKIKSVLIPEDKHKEPEIVDHGANL
jgi:hypothetical protein